MIYKSILSLLTGLLLFSCTKAPEQPNIVFIFADQLRSQEVSCYGGQNIRTPNMDKLAEQGIRLNNAISTYPICSPFRGMLLTGLYPMNSGVTNNDHPLRDGLPSLAKACKEAGYNTAYIGKWHIDGRGRSSYIPPERRLGFDYWQALECTHRYFESKYYENDSDSLRQWPGYDAEAQTLSAIQYIKQRDKDKPFFMMLSWGPPHGPYIAPKEYMDAIDPEMLTLRPNVKSSVEADKLHTNPRFNIPEIYKPAHKQRILDEMADETATRKATAGYLAATQAIDDYLGLLMDALKAEGLDENTIVVFTSDHGDQLSSHQFYDKNVPYEESISIPFLLKFPPKVKASTVSDVLLEPVDIMPTVLGLAGVPSPDIDGKDKSNIILEIEDDMCDAVLLMGLTHFNNTSLINGLDNWRGVRTKRYTYARYEDKSPWLLFDNANDPYQMQNLVGENKSQNLIKELDQTLDQLLLKAGDAEDTKALYDRIINENPNRTLLKMMRELNPGKY